MALSLAGFHTKRERGRGRGDVYWAPPIIQQQ